MKTNLSPSPLKRRRQKGSGLLVTIILTAISLATLAAAMAWSSSTTRLNERTSQYARSVAAAEAVTETVLARISQDHREGGLKLVTDNYNAHVYRNLVLTPSHSTGWRGWQFTDAQGNAGRTYVSVGAVSNYVVLDSSYAGLKGYVTTVNVVSNARLTNTIQNVIAGVRQSVQLSSIPIYQFAMFSSSYMEVSCGQPFNVTGRVHANGEIYVEPDSDLTFESSVTAASDILFQRHPDDSRGYPAGSVDYAGTKRANMPALTLPIGADNSPLAVRQIIQPPPAGEDVNSLIGRQRFYNQADMIITVQGNGTIKTTTGVPQGRTTIHQSHASKFANTTASFVDAREGKTVRPLTIDVDQLRRWALTNLSRYSGRPLSSVYVEDKRNLTVGELAAVRVKNGRTLPPKGLTIATARPLYVEGHYNQPNNLHLGTANTSATLPASFAADAIIVLSEAWEDANSTLSMSSRDALPTTVNAAFLTGVVETHNGQYSGGMENFPRFLEDWGLDNIFTYNGSMVKMFPSQYAIAPWGGPDVYNPPARNWTYDVNFNDPLKLPPLTPMVQKIIRGEWSSVPPNSLASAPLNL